MNTEILNTQRKKELGYVLTVPTFPVPTAQPVTSGWDKFNSIVGSIFNVTNQAIDTVQNLKNGTTQTAQQTQQQLAQQQQALQQQQKGNILKYVLIAAGVLAGGAVVYKLASGGKKKKSLSGHAEETIDVAATVLEGPGAKKSRKSYKSKAKKAKAKKVRL